jgi:hypothetical protein
MKYCTYLTTYSGNRFPQFYIGSGQVDKIESGQYIGSPQSKNIPKKEWIKEYRANPHLFKVMVLTRHSTWEEARDRERRFQKQLKVVSNPLYANFSYASRLGGGYELDQGPNKGRKLSEEWKSNIARGSTGRVFSQKSREKKSASLQKHYDDPVNQARATQTKLRSYEENPQLRELISIKAKDRWDSPKGEAEKRIRSERFSKNNPNSKGYIPVERIITDPNGNDHVVTNLREFAQSVGLNLLSFKTNISSHGKYKGYKLKSRK